MQDVITQKNALRQKAKAFRKGLSIEQKAKKDEIIFEKIISLDSFKSAENVLCYVSAKGEIDTKKLIKFSLENGKKVAVPKCSNTDGEMDFYYISSLDELKAGKYNILEPSDTCKKYKSSKNSICIVPSLAVDKENYRLGYGKGYYDRFLSNFSGEKIVLCYKEFVVQKLPVFDKFDIKSDICITD